MAQDIDPAPRRVVEAAGGPVRARMRAVPLDLPRTPLEGISMRGRMWRPRREGAPKVVLVHGLVVSSAFLVPSGERLGRGWRALAPDLPGFGLSDTPKRALSVPELGTALLRWIESAEIGRASLVAVSFGCQVATEVAMRRPDLVDRVVLASPTVDPAARSLSEQLRLWLRETRTQSWALRKLIVREYARAGLPRALRTFRYALEDRIEDRLPFVEAPTLVLRGTADPIVPDRWAREVAGLLPNGRVEALPGAPHAMCFDAPEPFSGAADRFLEEG